MAMIPQNCSHTICDLLPQLADSQNFVTYLNFLPCAKREMQMKGTIMIKDAYND